MPADILNTNEVKDSGGGEVEFTLVSNGPGRSKEWSRIGEIPARPERLVISHSESGSGINLIRRSRIGFTKNIVGQVDDSRVVAIQAYTVMQIPIGNMTAHPESANTLAYLMSFIASLGATTTILYDGTGNGAVSLIKGTL